MSYRSEIKNYAQTIIEAHGERSTEEALLQSLRLALSGRTNEALTWGLIGRAVRRNGSPVVTH